MSITGLNIRKKLGAKLDELLGDKVDRAALIRQAFLDALEDGVETAVRSACQEGGFNLNQLVRIPWPPELMRFQETIQKYLPDHYERFIVTMNEAAERASGMARSVLVDAVKGITTTDAKQLIRSDSPTACTEYFDRTCSPGLYTNMFPIVNEAIEACSVTKYWDEMKRAYESIPGGVLSLVGLPPTIETDLDAYVTQKAIGGIMTYVAERERCIRADPMTAVSEAVQQVFSRDFDLDAE